MPETDVMILDGAVLVNILKPGGEQTFTDYAVIILLPYIIYQVHNVLRLDVVWDQYQSNSLTSRAREEQGKGIRRRIDGSNALPTN